MVSSRSTRVFAVVDAVAPRIRSIAVPDAGCATRRVESRDLGSIAGLRATGVKAPFTLSGIISRAPRTAN
jgi:hypothetical protein